MKEREKCKTTSHHWPQCAKWFSRYRILKSGIWEWWTSPFCRFQASFSLKYDFTDAILQILQIFSPDLPFKGLRCFCNIEDKEGRGSFWPPPLTQKPKNLELCTIIAYYITSITKQLEFINFHCSIVRSYCSVVCLIAKNKLKMIEF